MGNYLLSLRAPSNSQDERNHPLYYDWSLPKWSPFKSAPLASGVEGELGAVKMADNNEKQNKSNICEGAVARTQKAVSDEPQGPAAKAPGGPVRRPAASKQAAGQQRAATNAGGLTGASFKVATTKSSLKEAPPQRAGSLKGALTGVAGQQVAPPQPLQPPGQLDGPANKMARFGAANKLMVVKQQQQQQPASKIADDYASPQERAAAHLKAANATANRAPLQSAAHKLAAAHQQQQPETQVAVKAANNIHAAQQQQQQPKQP